MFVSEEATSLFNKSYDAIVGAFEHQLKYTTAPITVGFMFLEQQFIAFISMFRRHSLLGGFQRTTGSGLGSSRISEPGMSPSVVRTIICMYLSGILARILTRLQQQGSRSWGGVISH